MGELVKSDAEQAPHADNNTLLLIDQSGRILKVLECGAHAPVPDRKIDASESLTLESLWSAAVADTMRAVARRAIRARSSFSETLLLDGEASGHECLCIPQGRDSALLLIRGKTAHAQDIDEIRKLAYEDSATGLPNKQKLLLELQHVIDLQGLRGGRSAVLCLHFGDIDDNGCGLTANQQEIVLREVAERLAAQIRGTNEPIEPDMERVTLVARSDYRQFTVVLPSIDTGDDAEAVAQRIVTALREPLTLGERTVWISPRVGIALYPQDGDTGLTLLQNAQVAMEDARHAEDAGFRMHSGTVRLRSLQRQDLTCELRSALDRKEFRLNYLPIVTAGNGYPLTLEALLRWPDSLLDSASIEKTVAVAERTGLIIQIGDWVLETALQALADWQRSGHETLRLALNLSAQEFSRPDVCDRIGSRITAAGVATDAIDIEINEYMLQRDAVAGFPKVRALKALGVNVTIDDFGTGPVALAQLANSGVDGLKIDRSLVDNMVFSKVHRAACAAAIGMAKSLSMEVTAEGVENEDQLISLRELGCDLMQGFLFSRPLAEYDVADYLAITGRYRNDDWADV